MNSKFKESKLVDNICLVLLFIMFCGMFAHSTIAYVRAIPQLLLSFIAVVRFIISLKNKDISKYRNFFKFALWYLIFVLFNVLSLKWTISVSYSEDLISSLWFGFNLLLILTNFITSFEKLIKVIKVMIFAMIYMCLLILISDMGLRGTDAFGSVTGIYFNRIALILDYGIFLCIYIFKKEKKGRYLLPIPLYFLVIFFTGSRKSLLMPFAFLALFMFLGMGKDVNKIIKTFFTAIVLFFVVVFVVSINPVLEKRVMDLVYSVVQGEETTDASIIERTYFRHTAFEMFKESPIKGHGSNSFRAYLTSINYRHVTYCHCNFLEILATLGFIGFSLYYVMYFCILRKGMHNFDKNNLEKIFSISFIITEVIFEYGFVSFYFFDLQSMIAIVYFIACNSERVNINYENCNINTVA